MNLAKKLLQLALIVSMSAFNLAQADDLQDITKLIQNLYNEDVKPLICIDSRGEQDVKLVAAAERYFSLDFMKYYQPVCVNLATDVHGDIIWIGDLRTGEQNSFSYSDSKAGFTNLKIGQPKISGNQARIRATYDLPDSTYIDFGNFTVFSLIKENRQWKIDDIELGGHDLDKYNERDLPSIKSLKQYIKKNLIEAEAKKKTSTKKKSPK